ncbi:hypothetical protein AKJ51_02890 [candidate division MSBL1 archaeon SCGC-AAA382A20]|uniref:Alpha-L-rhamnosidase n=1 Tax=candidate division MSBL1 archaeon SCGC-AAA382A20 TaxID=1698280 RepID=A0A133VK27_9EURY|nr:hypothetical protein AKJ51_02890 [candidate division MSBL1 archaeon SCGC-AAA382A20]
MCPGKPTKNMEKDFWKDSEAYWITCKKSNHSKSNQWICYRKTFRLFKLPKEAPLRIAVDSKYWLWLNGKLAVRGGQLKRGPTPMDTYYDLIDLHSYLLTGSNTIAILQWYFGKDGFSHINSGKAAMLLEGQFGEKKVVTDSSWKVKMNPAFGDTGKPFPNYRLPESNIRYNAERILEGWEKSNYDDSNWGSPKLLGKPGDPPWNQLVKRPIPQWDTSDLREYKNLIELALPRESTGEKLTCDLPYGAQVTPYLKIKSPRGKKIDIWTDSYEFAGALSLRAEYISRQGEQEYENFGWMSGHKVHYYIPEGVEILDLRYRESGYDVDFAGEFKCNDGLLNSLWEKGRRSLYVNMRDTYFDCPERERAQWWGDVVNELSESFYVLGRKSDLLTKKAINELIGWQRTDNSVFSPVPSGNWDRELPTQMLNSVGYFGLWTYYKYTGDESTIRAVYPGVKRYLSIWEQDPDGLVKKRDGGWAWLDWGENIDETALYNLWFYLALMGQRNMAQVCEINQDLPVIEGRMKELRDNFNKIFWNGTEYRSSDYDGETDDRVNALAVLAGLAEEEKFPYILTILQNHYHSSPYMERYVLEALFRMRRPLIAIRRMRERYRPMVEDWRSTLWEFWEGKEGSYNHGWSGGPAIMMGKYLAGIAPDCPGFKTYSVLPQMGDITYVYAKVSLRRGSINVEVQKWKNTFELQITSPPGTEATVGVPKKEFKTVDSILVNDTLVWEGGKTIRDLQGVSFGGETKYYYLFQVYPGCWIIKAQGIDLRP